jgi:hypothetical protein
MGTINKAQNTDQWQALVSTIMNLRDPKKVGEFLE